MTIDSLEPTDPSGPATFDTDEGFVQAGNLYERTTTIVDRFADGSQELVKHEVVLEQPPCQHGFGCRAVSPDQTRCGFDPKTGACNGQMP